MISGTDTPLSSLLTDLASPASSSLPRLPQSVSVFCCRLSVSPLRPLPTGVVRLLGLDPRDPSTEGVWRAWHVVDRNPQAADGRMRKTFFRDSVLIPLNTMVRMCGAMVPITLAAEQGIHS